ncbi:MAG: ATP-binding cassette domain-containing protein, partial [Clostridiales bacterium]|nr:ATP-binding cassette domain-containing protein [Clostridiales bacterium]
MSGIIEIHHLCKHFGDVKAVQDVSFQVKKGELFAFLGVNGAGKSTTIHIMCGQLSKDSGSIVIDGRDLDQDVDSIKGELGVVFQNSVLDSALTVYDNLESRAALYHIFGQAFRDRLAALADKLEFKDLLKRTVGKLSGGQRRRIDIARALLHRPKILILDEPTTGLDPQTRKILWDVISDLRKNENLTVFLTTHYMEEAAEADYVVILDSGKISAQGTPLELKNTYTGDYICQRYYVNNQRKLVRNKGEKQMYYIRHDHPAIISEELWETAQEKLAKKSERNRQGLPSDEIAVTKKAQVLYAPEKRTLKETILQKQESGFIPDKPP